SMRYAPISAAGLPPTWGWSAMHVSWPSSSLKRCPSDRPGRTFHGEATRKLISAFDPARDFQAANTTRTLDPRTLALELDKLLPQDRNIVVDGGNFLGVVPYLNVPDPGCFKMIGDFASIGLGFGAALGVSKARPDKNHSAGCRRRRVSDDDGRARDGSAR